MSVVAVVTKTRFGGIIFLMCVVQSHWPQEPAPIVRPVVPVELVIRGHVVPEDLTLFAAIWRYSREPQDNTKTDQVKDLVIWNACHSAELVELFGIAESESLLLHTFKSQQRQPHTDRNTYYYGK